MAPADGSGGQAEVPAFLQHDEDQLHEASYAESPAEGDIRQSG